MARRPRSRPPLPALALALGLGALPTLAQEPPAAAPPPAEAPGQAAPEPSLDEAAPPLAAVEHGLHSVVERFDRFFADDRVRDLERPSTRLRLKNALRFEDGGRWTDRVSLSATLTLPALDRWLGNARLVLTGANSQVDTPATGDGEGASAQPAPGETLDPARLQPRAGAAELRVDLFRGAVVSGDLGGGVKWGRPLVPYARARAHLRAEPAEGLVLRSTAAIFYELQGDGLGTTGDLTLDWYLTEHVRGRLSTGLRWTEVTRGLEWSQAGGLAWVSKDRYGVYVAAQALAVTRPVTFDATRLFCGVRSNLWRGRLFGQVEPELAWIEGAVGPLHRVLAVTATLELLLESRPDAVGQRAASPAPPSSQPPPSAR